MVLCDHVRNIPKASAIQMSKLSSTQRVLAASWSKTIRTVEQEAISGGGSDMVADGTPADLVVAQQIVPSKRQQVDTAAAKPSKAQRHESTLHAADTAPATAKPSKTLKRQESYASVDTDASYELMEALMGDRLMAAVMGSPEKQKVTWLATHTNVIANKTAHPTQEQMDTRNMKSFPN